MISLPENIHPRTLLRVAGLLFIFILLFAIVASYFSFQHRQALKTNGVHIQATIVEIGQLGGKNKITYQFQVEGKTYLDSRRAPVDFHPGDLIEVIYLAENPEINDLASALESN